MPSTRSTFDAPAYKPVWTGEEATVAVPRLRKLTLRWEDKSKRVYGSSPHFVLHTWGYSMSTVYQVEYGFTTTELHAEEATIWAHSSAGDAETAKTILLDHFGDPATPQQVQDIQPYWRDVAGKTIEAAEINKYISSVRGAYNNAGRHEVPVCEYTQEIKFKFPVPGFKTIQHNGDALHALAVREGMEARITDESDAESNDLVMNKQPPTSARAEDKTSDDAPPSAEETDFIDEETSS